MIAANELRIGNWIVHSGGQQVKVVDIQLNKNHDGINSQSSVHFTPIPLTPEILEACGFRNKPGIEWWVEYESDVFLSFNSNMLLTHAYDLEQYVSYEYPKVKHLHQLQNLYFALTGTELEYKPKKIST